MTDFQIIGVLECWLNCWVATNGCSHLRGTCSLGVIDPAAFFTVQYSARVKVSTPQSTFHIGYIVSSYRLDRARERVRSKYPSAKTPQNPKDIVAKFPGKTPRCSRLTPYALSHQSAPCRPVHATTDIRPAPHYNNVFFGQHRPPDMPAGYRIPTPYLSCP